MADIVMGCWTTHGPQLNTSPQEWLLRVPADKKRRHYYDGIEYSFDELVELRAAENLLEQSSVENRTERHARCQKAIAVMAAKWKELKPDVAIIFGNDQRELMLETLRPCFTVFCGEQMKHGPLAHHRADRLAPGIRETEWAYRPEQDVLYPGLPALANRLVEKGIERGFDFAYSNEWPSVPDNHWHTGTPHAFAWIFRRIMEDAVVPTLPIVTNTFFPPNQPRAWRCFEMGQLVHEVVQDFEPGMRVAVFGSGGMSHFVINEPLDLRVMDAIQRRDANVLKSFDPILAKDSTSELLNWIGAAGCLFKTDLSGGMLDYVPCYRSEAGTGTAQGFMLWE